MTTVSVLGRVAAFVAMALLGVAAAPTAFAQQAPAPDATERSTPPTPRPWQSLDPAERDVLAPLQSDWDKMSPRRQAHMLNRAQRWVTLDPERRAEVTRNLAHWQQMSPAERKQARENMRKFHHLTPEQRKQLHATFERFQQLPPAQRDKLLREWHALPTKQRLDWKMPASAGSVQEPAQP